MIRDRILSEIQGIDNQMASVRARAQGEITRLEAKKAALTAALSSVTPEIEIVVERLKQAGFLGNLG